jgi:hypothetical protein
MSLAGRAAALATGAGGLRGWAAKAQCAGGMEAGWRVDDPVADTFVVGGRAIR